MRGLYNIANATRALAVSSKLGTKVPDHSWCVEESTEMDPSDKEEQADRDVN
jgi:hypothetical protein